MARDEARAIHRGPFQQIGMRHDHIAVVSGSQCHDSFNHKLARAMVTGAPTERSFTLASIDDVPLDEWDDDANRAAAVTRQTHEFQDAQGLLFVTPV
jgi:NAD(P)H-dependent FMN reductase